MALAKIADLKVFGINCSLKSSKDSETSSTDALMQQFFGERMDAFSTRTSPKIVAKWNKMLASNTAHLARRLKLQQYPGIKGGR